MNGMTQLNPLAGFLTSLPDYFLQSDESVDHILHAVRSHLGMDVAFVSEFTEGRRVFRHVDAMGEVAPIAVGDGDPITEGYCQRVVNGLLPELIPDTSAVPAALAIPATVAVPVGAHLSVPIRLRDGRVYGTFCCFSFAPDHTLDERDLSVMRAFAALAAEQIDRHLESTRAREERIARIISTIKLDRFSTVYQPIHDLMHDRIVGFECLTRFSAQPTRAPDLWFAEAAEVGLGIELELATLRKALATLPSFPPDIYLALNVSPAAILSGEIAKVLDHLPAGRIVLEVTEHADVLDYADMRRALEALRRRDVLLAVDDAGAGYASLRHILHLQPDIIKLDISLTRNIDRDPARRALTAALIEFAQETGSELVAEGVETAEELSVLRTLGVKKAQGYLLGRPMSFEHAIGLHN